MQTTLQERIIAALSKAREKYSELEGVIITLRFKTASMLVQARVKRLSLEKRTYEITISTSYKNLFQEASQEALIGWFAHELSKIGHYHKQNIVGLSSFKIRYLLNTRFKRKVERGTDMNVIDHGLGKELLASRNVVLKSELLPEPYKRKLRVYALSTREISSITKTKKDKGQTLHV